MKVSVVTVCFNSASTLADCLRSVAVQSHADIEHIVVDGGSTDNTSSIVTSADSRVSRFISEPDEGIYDAMNKGMEASTGDLIGYLNADDTFADQHSVSTLAALSKSENCHAVYGDLRYVAANDPSRTIRKWRAGAFARSRLKYGWMPPHPTFYVNRELFQRVGRFDSTLRIAADYDYMLRCLTLDGLRVGYLPRVLVDMRTGGASNRSLRALVGKSREDLHVLRRNRVGGIGTLLLKNIRKIPQFI